MMLRALEILRETPNPTREAVREGLASQLCRCTGYQFIVDAVMDAAQRMQRGTAGVPSGAEALQMREQPAEAAAGQPPGQPLGATEHGPDLDAVATHVATAMPQEDEIHRMEREGRDLGTITAHPPIEEERTP
jgi:hypothetical protein